MQEICIVATELSWLVIGLFQFTELNYVISPYISSVALFILTLTGRAALEDVYGQRFDGGGGGGRALDSRLFIWQNIV